MFNYEFFDVVDRVDVGYVVFDDVMDVFEIFVGFYGVDCVVMYEDICFCK